MGKLQVCRSQCNQCLFGPNKIVSDQRKREILADCRASDAHFECHKHDGVVCGGFFSRFSTNLIRIMGRLGGIEFI